MFETDCVYEKKYKLSDVAYIINSLSNYKVDVNLMNEKLGLDYCGVHHNLDIEFEGLKLGIENISKNILLEAK